MKEIILAIIFVTTPSHPWNAEQITRAYRHTVQGADYWRQQGIADFQIGRVGVIGKDDFKNYEWRTETEFYNWQPREQMTFYWTRECKPTEGGMLYNGWTWAWKYILSKQCDLPWDYEVPAHEMGHWFWWGEDEIDTQIAAFNDKFR